MDRSAQLEAVHTLEFILHVVHYSATMNWLPCSWIYRFQPSNATTRESKAVTLSDVNHILLLFHPFQPNSECAILPLSLSSAHARPDMNTSR